jgi:hypothetical protein
MPGQHNRGLEGWFLRSAIFKTAGGRQRDKNEAIEKGDHYRLTWFGYNETSAEENEILFSNGKDEFQFGFSGGCIVNVIAKEETGETICEL